MPSPSGKRQKKNGTESSASCSAAAASRIRSAAEEFVCPITRELPVDPVLAEDGRIYERSELERWIRTAEKEEEGLRSPWTQLAMGPRIVPSPQVRISIENMVESGLVPEGLSRSWRNAMKRIDRDKRIAEVRNKADEGKDGYSMLVLGTWYAAGQMGLVQDDALAKKWYQRGADLRNHRCLEILAESGQANEMFWVGYGYHWGKFGFPQDRKLALEWWEKGAKKNHATSVVHLGLAAVIPYEGDEQPKDQITHGVFLISEGAAMGSKTGMYLLGSINFFGSHGLPTNYHMATYWLKKAIRKCSKSDLTDGCLKTAKQMLWSLQGNEDNPRAVEFRWVSQWYL